MSGQALDLVRSATIVWRHKILAGSIVLLGLAGNVGYTMAQPQVYTASTLVVLSPPLDVTGSTTPPAVDVSTQSVVITSVPVLSDALRTAHLGLTLTALRKRVLVTSAGTLTIAISARGDTAQQAERTANAVTRSYLGYVTSAGSPGEQQPAQLLQLAQTATAKPRTTRVYQAAAAGGLAGALVALIAVLAIWRDDRRLRERDAIADSIGVPVLASVRACRPAGAAGWTRLLERYEPAGTDPWLLHRALRDLGLLSESSRSGARSVAVLSLSADRDALALGPQLAVFAAAAGIPAALVIGAGQDTKRWSALRAACGSAAGRYPGKLRVIVTSHEDVIQVPAHAVTVAVDMVDATAPCVATTVRAAVTVLAVTAGAVTAEQLVRVLASAADAGRTIAGVLVANPGPGDQTTGRLPQLARSHPHRMPARIGGVMTESRR